MLYAIIFIVGAAVGAYVIALWLIHETREASGAIGARLKLLTGGWTNEALLQRTQTECANGGLNPDFIVISNSITPVYDALRGKVLASPIGTALPAGLVLAMAADVSERRLYLHAVEAARPARPGNERRFTISFDDVNEIETISNSFDTNIVPSGQHAVAFRLANAPAARYDVIVEPAWAVAAKDLASQLRSMVIDEREPPAAPVVVR
jgi:hypothetical protein